ncbi:NADPH-dependent oxidoreductase [Bdellovibrio sp. qaytius]|nr:NADPH-dependent oxidoreductase [Bdellovibrio sp. qaytius]
MSSLFDALEKHVSVRSYKSDPIPQEVLDQILNAATRASSSGNMQSYSIIVTTDTELKQKLYEPHFKQDMVLDAPAVVTFCADFHRMRRWLKLRNAADNFDNFMSFMIASIDAILASQNAALAAEGLGLGICYMGTTLASCGEIAKILECPEGVVPVVGFSLGYPNEKPELRDRLPLKALVHNNTYQKRTDAEIIAEYSQREIKGWERYMSQPHLKAAVEKNGIENLAQVYTQLKYTKASHEEYSNTVMACLKEQGFLA